MLGGYCFQVNKKKKKITGRILSSKVQVIKRNYVFKDGLLN